MTQPQVPDHASYADWDAAYVLGALSVEERRRYEHHLANCRACTSAVAAIAGIPGLLGQVQADDVRALLVDPTGTEDDTAGRPPADLLPRLERAERRRRGRRLRAVWLGVAAAVVIAVGAVVIPRVWPGNDSPVIATALTPISGVPVSAEVQMFTEEWGTRIEMTCSYVDRSADPGRTWNYALYVVGRNGTADEISSWTARAGSTATASATTRLPIEQITAVQVRSMTSGKVLLSADLP